MGEYVLITGASSGIGKAFANEYAKKGKNLILVARNKEKLDNLKNGLTGKYNVDVKVIQLDLSIQDSANKLFESIKKEEIFVDTLINNAGFGLKGNLLSYSVEDYYEMMNLNMITLTGLTHMFLEPMIKNGKGIIINVGSLVSFMSAPYNVVYSATKAFVLSFTEGLYYEYKDKGVQFVAICPGATNTCFFDKAGKSKASGGKLREPEQVVETALKGLKKNKPFVVDGPKTKFTVLLSKLLPRKVFPILLSKMDTK